MGKEEEVFGSKISSCRLSFPFSHISQAFLSIGNSIISQCPVRYSKVVYLDTLLHQGGNYSSHAYFVVITMGLDT